MAEAAIWQVRLRKGWINVGPEDQAYIESGYISGELEFRYTARNQTYTVDLQRNLQRDSHGKERPLRRTAGTEDRNAAGDVNPDVGWEVEESLRYKVRDETAMRVIARLGVMSSHVRDVQVHLGEATPDAALRADMTMVTLFSDSREKGLSRVEEEEVLLRRFDVLACPCEMEFDETWQQVDSAGFKPRFWVHHVAALNVGESGNAPDFRAYSDPSGDLDEAAYLGDMHRVFANLFEAQSHSGVENSVLVPIGMGAFLRQLARNDPKYAVPECNNQLRYRIAREIARAIQPCRALSSNSSSSRRPKLHVCIQEGDGGEADQNKNALLQALIDCGLGENEACICVGQDATAVAVGLARTWWSSGDRHSADAIAPVSLVNAANARLLGNHWFSGGAMRAIDENIHRRAPLLASISLLLNGGTAVRRRHDQELAEHVVTYGGQVVFFDSEDKEKNLEPNGPGGCMQGLGVAEDAAKSRFAELREEREVAPLDVSDEAPSTEYCLRGCCRLKIC